MAQNAQTITIKVDVKLSFLSAIKLRIAGKYLPEIKDFIKTIEGKKHGKK